MTVNTSISILLLDVDLDPMLKSSFGYRRKTVTQTANCFTFATVNFLSKSTSKVHPPSPNPKNQKKFTKYLKRLSIIVDSQHAENVNILASDQNIGLAFYKLLCSPGCLDFETRKIVLHDFKRLCKVTNLSN